MKKYTVSFFMSMAAAIAVAGEMSMELLDGECWWGGHSF